VASTRPSNRESPAKTSRTWFVLVGIAALVVAVLGCAALAWLTGAGTLGFGIAMTAVLTLAVGTLLLRELRRVARTVRRIENQVRRVRRDSEETRARLDPLDRRTVGMLDAVQATRAAIQEIDRSASAQRLVLDALIANQLETNRVMATGLRPDTLQAQLATQLRQQQAMVNLFALAPIRDVVPAMGGWAASADVVALLVSELLRIRPGLVVECGSGVSTLWMALAIEHHALDCRIVSLDHDPRFAEQTRRSLRAHGVEQHVEVRDAPLVACGLPGHSTPWYDPVALNGLEAIGLVFVDGPPDATGPLVRYPAVPLLAPLLAPTATLVLDDLIRPGEKEVVARWRLQLPDFEVELVPLQKSAAVFRRAPSPAHD